MSVSSAKFLLVNHLVCHRLHHVRTGYEHVALLLYHEDKVGQGGRIACSSGTRAEDCGELRYHARCHSVLIEDGSVTGKSRYSLLNTCSTGVVKADYRRSVFERELLHFYYLGRVCLAQRAAVSREVVSVDKHLATVNLTVSAHNAVTRNLFLFHSEACAPVVHKLVEFAERAFIKQCVYTFAGCHVPSGVLFLYLVKSSAQ